MTQRLDDPTTPARFPILGPVLEPRRYDYLTEARLLRDHLHRIPADRSDERRAILYRAEAFEGIARRLDWVPKRRND